MFIKVIEHSQWTQLVSRPVTEEEKLEGCQYDFMWECDTPELGQEVLVSDGNEVWTDTWVDYGDGLGFENCSKDIGLYWMSFPDPPSENETNR